jgi:dTDP-4-dehydrorhamnose 3,5-epimerase
METYHREKFIDLGIDEVFVQDNQSFSTRNTLRGLHYQLKHPQAKLCRVIQGEALDVAVDLRRGSPHYGKWTSVILSAEKRNQIYIPAGFAHGFLALTEIVEFFYKCSALYNKDDEFGVVWNDPGIGINWGAVDPAVSPKDTSLPALDSVPPENLPIYNSK